MSDWKKHYEERTVSMEKAVKAIKDGDVIYCGSSSETSCKSIDALADRYEELRDVTVISNLLLEPVKMVTDKKYKKAFHFITLFMDAVERMGVKTGVTDVASIPYSYVERALREVYKVNVVMVEMTEPDENGYCNVGIAGTGWAPACIQYAEKVIAVINSGQYRAKGRGVDPQVHVSQIDWFCRDDHPVPEFSQPQVQDIDLKVAPYILQNIKDGDTIQIGRGGLSNAIGYGLKERKNLKVHTEITTDSLVELAKAGVVDHIYSSAAFGTREVYDFSITDKADFGDAYHILDPDCIGAVDNLVSINQCLMADLTGQVCSEAVGPRQHSCVGGQLDFVKGAAKSKGGKSFLCLRSTYTDKEGGLHSNILSTLPTGAVVTTPRSEVMYIVSEYGIADLYLKTLKQRIKAMISIAHPDFREQLRREAIAGGFIHEDDFD